MAFPKETDWEVILEQTAAKLGVLEIDYKNDTYVIRRSLGQANRNRAANNAAQNQPPNRANTSSPSAYSPSGLGPPSFPPVPASPSASTAMTVNDQAHQNNQAPKKLPFFFREDYAGFIVKGNFMTLAARPHLVEEGEWLAHQRK